MKLPFNAALAVCVYIAFSTVNANEVTNEVMTAVIDSDAVVEKVPSLQLNGGLDLRLRQELWDHIPIPGGGGGKQENFFRFRARAWGEAKYGEDFRWFGRISHEWRKYIARRDVVSNFTWPDELVLDNFFVDINNCFDDQVDFRIGRQELNYFGSWRIFGDGTPGDGSRTFYSDAAVATWRIDDENDLIFFGLYDMPYNYFTIGDPTGAPAAWRDERQLTQIEPSARDMEDAGAGLYFITRAIDKTMPLEAYFIWRRQGDYKIADVARPGRDIYTQGVFFKPKLSETFSAEIEAAWQLGKIDDGRDLCAWMFYASTTWRPAATQGWKPYVMCAFYALSGDANPDKGTDTNWNPLWGRHSILSELLFLRNCGYYGMGYWANMFYPYLGAGAKVGERQSFQSHTGPVFAETSDVEWTRSGGHGQYQGWLGALEYAVLLVKGALSNGRGDISGLVRAEAFAPGEYTSPRDGMAYFLRFQIQMAY